MKQVSPRMKYAMLAVPIPKWSLRTGFSIPPNTEYNVHLVKALYKMYTTACLCMLRTNLFTYKVCISMHLCVACSITLIVYQWCGHPYNNRKTKYEARNKNKKHWYQTKPRKKSEHYLFMLITPLHAYCRQGTPEQTYKIKGVCYLKHTVTHWIKDTENCKHRFKHFLDSIFSTFVCLMRAEWCLWGSLGLKESVSL